MKGVTGGFRVIGCGCGDDGLAVTAAELGKKKQIENSSNCEESRRSCHAVELMIM